MMPPSPFPQMPGRARMPQDALARALAILSGVRGGAQRPPRPVRRPLPAQGMGNPFASPESRAGMPAAVPAWAGGPTYRSAPPPGQGKPAFTPLSINQGPPARPAPAAQRRGRPEY